MHQFLQQKELKIQIVIIYASHCKYLGFIYSSRKLNMLSSFDSKYTQALENGEVSILLGNGFSQAWDSSIFNYKNLLSSASFGLRNTAIKSIFSELKTYDFEKVMLALQSAEVIFRNYNIPANKIYELQQDQDLLKNGLIQVISNQHPQRSSSVSTVQYQAAKPFTCLFNKIFTVNYDLLLYWIINKTEISPLGYRHSDGFNYETWIARPEQSIFFLHGGLHLYDDGVSIKKHRFNDDIDISIAEQVRSNLQVGNFPLFVSEPTSTRKLNKIKHNPYLNHAFSKLQELEGSLFIHGHSMDSNDAHIFDKIHSSNVRNIYIGLFGDENSEANRTTKANSLTYLQRGGKIVEFYDSSTASIWS